MIRNDYITPQSASSNAAGPSNYPGAYEMGHDGLGVTVSNRVCRSSFSIFLQLQLHSLDF